MTCDDIDGEVSAVASWNVLFRINMRYIDIRYVALKKKNDYIVDVHVTAHRKIR
jgi:hypothetical protein